MLFDKRTVLCADFAGAPKLPPVTFVRAPTLFVVETQYTPKKKRRRPQSRLWKNYTPSKNHGFST